MPRPSPAPFSPSLYVPGVAILVGGSAATQHSPRAAWAGVGIGYVLVCASVAVAMHRRRGAKDPPIGRGSRRPSPRAAGSRGDSSELPTSEDPGR